jgi:hypothetical protein
MKQHSVAKEPYHLKKKNTEKIYLILHTDDVLKGNKTAVS